MHVLQDEELGTVGAAISENGDILATASSHVEHGIYSAFDEGTLFELTGKLLPLEAEGSNMTDSTLETLKHSRRVDELLLQMISELQHRVTRHDLSKMEHPELETFDKFSPKLKESTYGSDEYKGFLNEMKPALDHHYAMNRHHPEHFENGVNGMTLVDLVEMLADWKAAGERHADGSLAKSLDIQRERFGLSDQLFEILTNTARSMGWI